MLEKFLVLIKDQLYSTIYPENTVRLDNTISSLFQDKSALEVGGPSDFFKRNFPIYKKLKSLDIVNYAEETLWEKKGNDQYNYYFYKDKKAIRIYHDAVSLTSLTSNKYDCVISCNSLEHIANPLKALIEWKRVCKEKGVMVLVLPRKKSNFDWKRPTSTFQQLLDSYENNTNEDDLSNLEEILTLHDISRDPEAGTFEDFKKRSLDNFKHRGLHHYVYDQNLLLEILNYLNLEFKFSFKTKKDNLIVALT